MAKERKKKNSPQSTTPINVSLPVGMSAEEMQHVIAKALVEAEELKEQKKTNNERKSTQNGAKISDIRITPIKRRLRKAFLPFSIACSAFSR